MNVRVYLRRSKNDEGKQQFSLDVQRSGSREFMERLSVNGTPVSEYIDDGKAGDDFHSRNGLRRLLEDAQAGDIVICRDQSRLGRDAIEVTLVIRDLVRDRGCRLFYYITGQEVQFANAIDQATTFIQGTGHQMELEAIRSRTREALRSRVREGRVAGGVCYGYRLERKSDVSGRGYTIAVVDEAQAEVVRRIFTDYLNHKGIMAIAHALNREGVPPPTVGRRGSGSWAPSGIRAMLRNDRYRGIYVHGRVKKVRRNGKLVRVKADPSDIITVDAPQWRIIEDDVWFAVQARFSKRAPSKKLERPRAKYPLSGIARCAGCGGAVGCSFARRKGGRVKAYACSWHIHRGSSVCPVTVHQPMWEVEEALIKHLQDVILTDETRELILSRLRAELEAQLPSRDVDIGALEAEVKEVKAERRRLAQAVAMAGDIPEIVTELQRRSARLLHLEAQIETAKRSPDDVAETLREVERLVTEKMADLRAALVEASDLRAVFLTLFPEGLSLEPIWVKTKRRRLVWRIKGCARLAVSPLRVVTPPGLEPGISA